MGEGHAMDSVREAARNVPLTNAEIEDHAQRTFQTYLAHLDRTYRDNPRDVEEEVEQLQLQADQLSDAGAALPRTIDPAVAQEMVEVEARTGATLERGSPTYERLAGAITRALLHATLGRRAAYRANSMSRRLPSAVCPRSIR